MLVNHSRTKRPHEALLQLDIELGVRMFSNRWETHVTNERPPLRALSSDLLNCEDSVWRVVCLGRMPHKK